MPVAVAVLADPDQYPDPVVRRKKSLLGYVHLGRSPVASRLADVGTAERYPLACRYGVLDPLL